MCSLLLAHSSDVASTLHSDSLGQGLDLLSWPCQIFPLGSRMLFFSRRHCLGTCLHLNTPSHHSQNKGLFHPQACPLHCFRLWVYQLHSPHNKTLGVWRRMHTTLSWPQLATSRKLWDQVAGHFLCRAPNASPATVVDAQVTEGAVFSLDFLKTPFHIPQPTTPAFPFPVSFLSIALISILICNIYQNI